MSPPEELLDGTGNWYIPDSIVSGGASSIDFTMTVIDPDGNTGTQRIQGDTIVDALLSLEFVITARVAQPLRTVQVPGEGAVVMAASPDTTHSCNRGTYLLKGNAVDIGRAYVGNKFDVTWSIYDLFDSYTSDANGPNSLTGDVEGASPIPSAINQGVTDTRLMPTAPFQKYIGSGDNFGQNQNTERYNILSIDAALAQNIIDNSDGLTPEIVTFGIIPDTWRYSGAGVLTEAIHDEAVLLQIFKNGVEIYSQPQSNIEALVINILTGEIIP
tara:strand:+ start:50 stop:865 length:816 start_codon:yes stop_codon:yes gene_type:complete